MHLTQQDFVTFAATFLGAFLGLGLTYLYDRHKNATSENEDRLKMLKGICHELSRNLNQIQETLTSAKAYEKLAAELNKDSTAGAGYLAPLPDIRLERAALDTAIFSGRFFLLDQHEFEEVAEQYRRIDVINRNSDDLRTIARAPVNRDYLPMILGLQSTSAGTMENLVTSIPNVIALLERRGRLN